MNFSNLSNALQAKQITSMNWIQSWGAANLEFLGALRFYHLWFSELYAICLTELYFMRG